jgi:hypothetical protein
MVFAKKRLNKHGRFFLGVTDVSVSMNDNVLLHNQAERGKYGGAGMR